MCARDDDDDEVEVDDIDTAEDDDDEEDEEKEEAEDDDDGKAPSLALLHGTRRKPAAAPLLNSHHFKCSSLVVPVLSQSSLSKVALRGMRRPLVQREAMGRRWVGSGAVEETWAGGRVGGSGRKVSDKMQVCVEGQREGHQERHGVGERCGCAEKKK